jgi:hypothetical protein
VVLKAFMDETGIHEGSPIVAVSAYVAESATWRRWRRKWDAAKAPTKIIHAADCANYKGEFKGWTRERRDTFVAKLLPILPAHRLVGMVFAIQMEDLKEALKGSEELLELLGNPYTCCFQWALMSIMVLAAHHGAGKRIKFIHEINDYKGEAIKTFEYVNEHHNPQHIAVTLAFGTKADNSQLQAADVLAYEAAKFLKDPVRPPRRSWLALEPDRTIIWHRFGKENIANLVAELRNFREKMPDPDAGDDAAHVG